MRASCWMRPAMEPGKRCTAGGVAHNAANSAGSASAIGPGSMDPNRSRILAGPRNACSMGVLLVEHHPDQQGERAVGEHLVGGGLLSDLQGHGSSVPVGLDGEHRARRV